MTLMLFLGFNLFSQNAIYTDYDDNKIIEYTLQDEDGKVLETGSYFNQKKVRTWTSYHPNGGKQTVAKFKNGLRHGNWFMYDEKGLLVFEITYKEGKKVSASQHSYASNN